jgi:hypothetical protein
MGLPLPAWLRWLFWAISAAMLALPMIMGLIAMSLLMAHGKPVAGLTDGVSEVIFATTFCGGPFVVPAFLARSVLKRALREGAPSLRKKRFIFVGAFVGTTISIGWLLLSFFQYPESMEILVLSPLWPFYVAFPGMAVGVLAEWGIFGLRQRLIHRNA